MATREQGIRRTTTVTVGLAAASIAGAFAVGAAAAANTTPKGSVPTDTTVDPGTSPSPADPQNPQNPLPGPPDDLGDTDGPPIVISVGS